MMDVSSGAGGRGCSAQPAFRIDMLQSPAAQPRMVGFGSRGADVGPARDALS